MCEKYIGSSISIEVGGGLGFYQGVVKAVNQSNQRITLFKVVQNGKPAKTDVTICAEDILNIKILNNECEGGDKNQSSSSSTNECEKETKVPINDVTGHKLPKFKTQPITAVHSSHSLEHFSESPNKFDRNFQYDSYELGFNQWSGSQYSKNQFQNQRCSRNQESSPIKIQNSGFHPIHPHYSHGSDFHPYPPRGSDFYPHPHGGDWYEGSDYLYHPQYGVSPTKNNMGYGNNNYNGRRKHRTSIGEAMIQSGPIESTRYSETSNKRQQWNQKKNEERNEMTFGTPIDEDIMNTEFDFESNLALFDKQAIMNKIENSKQPDVVRQTDRKLDTKKQECPEKNSCKPGNWLRRLEFKTQKPENCQPTSDFKAQNSENISRTPDFKAEMSDQNTEACLRKESNEEKLKHCDKNLELSEKNPESYEQKPKKNYKCTENVISREEIQRHIIIPPNDAAEVVYVTDHGLLVPSVTSEFLTSLLSTANQSGLTKSRQLEMIGRAATEVIISMIGGSLRLEPGNSHQTPTVAILCGVHSQGAAGVNCARQLEGQGVNSVVVLPSLSVSYSLSLGQEIQLYKMTNGKLVSDVESLPTTIDLVIDARFDYNGSVGGGGVLDPEEDASKNLGWLKRTNTWGTAARAPLVALDQPPCHLNAFNTFTHKVRLCPVLPLAFGPGTGRVYLMNLNIPQGIFKSLNVKYFPPFGSKMAIPLYECE